MNLTRLFTVLLLLLLTACLVQAANYMQVRVYIENKTNLPQLEQLNLDVASFGDDYLEIITNPTELEQITALGFRTEVVHADLETFYKSRVATKGNMGGYMTLSELKTNYIFKNILYPDIVSDEVVIGTTINGLDIWAFKISDNPNVDEDEPEILYYAAIHAREVITPLILLTFVDHLIDNYTTDPEIQELVNNREIWIILCANPDGYYYNELNNPDGGGMWRKNRRNNGDGSYGIDLNRNFGYEWGYDDIGSSPVTSSETYRGSAPFSEPETQALRDFITARQFDLVVSYHSYSNLFLWPWGYDYFHTEDDVIFTLLGDSVTAHNGYSPMPGWGLYKTNGGSQDWDYGEQTTKDKCLTVLFEVGGPDDGFWPDPSRIPYLTQENLEPNLFLSRIADSIYQTVPPKKPELSIEMPSFNDSYDISWTLNDSMNPAVEYELVEMEGRSYITDSATSFDNWINQGYSISTSQYYSPPSSFYTGAANALLNYMQLKESYLVNPGDTLKFMTKYQIDEYWDFAYVEVSTDGINYTSLPGNITTDENYSGRNRGYGITGNQFSWIQAEFDLSAYAGQIVDVRFSYSTDRFDYWEGMYIDDIYPIDSFATETVIASAIADTFYTFAGHSLGDYFYKVRAIDAQGQWSHYSQYQSTTVWERCLATGDLDLDGNPLSIGDFVMMTRILTDSIPPVGNMYEVDFDGDLVITFNDLILFECFLTNGLSCFDVYPISTTCDVVVDYDADGVINGVDNCPLTYNPDQTDTDGDEVGDACFDPCEGQSPGDANNDSNIDINDVVYLTEFIYLHSSAPGPLANGDPNGDCMINIGDLIYLSAYINAGGMAPVDCTCQNPDPTKCCYGITGNIEYDPEDIVDITDLVYFVDFQFRNGDAPPCLDEADIDGIAGIDIGDLVYLVNYQFRNGDALPLCPY